MRVARFAVGVLLATGSAAGAANLVENAGFDDDLMGWVALGAAIAHSTSDELGSPVSGSLEIAGQDPADSGGSAAHCVPVVAGRTYAFGASAFIPTGQPVNAAFVSVTWSSIPDCGELNLIPVSIPLPYFVDLKGVWATTQSWNTAPPGAQSARLELNVNKSGNAQVVIRARFDNVFFLEDTSCAPSPTTLCLEDGRFRVVAEWLTKQGDAGFGHAVPLTADSGYFWFFDAANVELVAKLIDACPTQFHRFWFFAAGLTDVETTIRVRDTGTDTERIYSNPQQTPFAPIQDTLAFDTCP